LWIVCTYDTRVDMWIKFEEGRSKGYQVIERNQF